MMTAFSSAPTAALSAVSKQYESFSLGPVSMAIPAGSIVGLVGENGAGKTTLLKLLTGALRPSGGEVTLFGKALADDKTRAAMSADVGVVFENAFFYDVLNAAQVGNCMAGIFGTRWDKAEYSALLRRFHLDKKQPMKEYSRGMRMKLSLAAALAHHPRFLVLDEATSGLDPVVRGEMLELFLDFIQDEEHAILMSSHITSDLEQVADSIAYLHHGQLLFHENKDELLEHYGVVHCAADRLAELPQALVVSVKHSRFGCEALVKNRTEAARLLPGAVCDPATIDDIMRFYAGRDEQ